MADNKQNTGKQDDIWVDINAPSEVKYLHKQFPGKTHDEIKQAIKAAGPMRKKIIECLNKQI